MNLANSIPTTRNNDGFSAVQSGAASMHRRHCDKVYLLTMKVAVEYHKHQLASAVCGARGFWFVNFPNVVLTAMSSILSFVTTSPSFMKPGAEGKRVIVSMAVGIMTIVVNFINGLQRKISYDSLVMQHKMATTELRRIMYSLESLRSEGLSAEEEKIEAAKIEAEFCHMQTLIGEEGDIEAPRITDAFVMLETQLQTRMHGERLDEGVPLAAAEALAVKIKNSRFFPLFLPKFDASIVKEVMGTSSIVKEAMETSRSRA